MAVEERRQGSIPLDGRIIVENCRRPWKTRLATVKDGNQLTKWTFASNHIAIQRSCGSIHQSTHFTMYQAFHWDINKGLMPISCRSVEDILLFRFFFSAVHCSYVRKQCRRHWCQPDFRNIRLTLRYSTSNFAYQS